MRWRCKLTSLTCSIKTKIIFSAAYEGIKDFEDKKKLVIIKSSDDEIFCSGGDVVDVVSCGVERMKDLFRYGYRGVHHIATYKIPYVALINGSTIGGASMFTMSAKYRVATEKTSFAMPETSIGFFNDSGASFFLSRLRNKFGIYMGLTGAKLTGFDVMKFGIASHFVESKNVRDLEHSLTTCETHVHVENVLEEFSFTPTKVESKFDENLLRIENCFGGLTVEQIIDNLKNDGSDWANETLKTLRQMSPTSVKVCHRHLNLGRHMSLEECLTMEWRLAVHFATANDFDEGTRAMILDKDMEPKWNPPSIEDVSEGQVARFFSPLLDGDQLTFEVKRCTQGYFVP